MFTFAPAVNNRSSAHLATVEDDNKQVQRKCLSWSDVENLAFSKVAFINFTQDGRCKWRRPKG